MIATGINNRSFVTQIANEIMSTCHSLSIVDGVVVGDPLEVELCETAGWSLEISEDTKMMVAIPPHPQLNAGKEHFVLRQFEFTPEKLRAVTLLSRPSSFPGAAATVREYVVLLKGSPEKIISMSNPDTVPGNISSDLNNLAKKGFRVIALAFRTCGPRESQESIMSKTQEELEQTAPITFLGLVCCSNSLKPDTYPETMQNLNDANIHVNMITGDHFYTAAAIARDCDILAKDSDLYLIEGSTTTDELTGEVTTKPIIVNLTTDARSLDMSIEELIEFCRISKVTSKKIETKFLSNKDIQGEVQAHSSNVSLTGSHNSGNNKYAYGRVTPLEGALFSDNTVNNFEEDEEQCIDIESLVTSPRVLHNNHVEIIAPESQIIMTGPGLHALEAHCPALLKTVCRATSVFARMKPDDKKRVVEVLMSCGEHVAFCGDGANDMEALNAATIGVSLCDAATTVVASIVSTKQSPLSV
eukprot:gene43630-54201_t